MQVLLDIKDNHANFFMELVKSLDYIDVIKEIKNKKKKEFVKDLAEAFEDVRLYSQGKKKLKNAKDFLNELRSQNH